MKMDAGKRILSLMLVLATLFLLPGVTQFTASASDALRERSKAQTREDLEQSGSLLDPADTGKLSAGEWRTGTAPSGIVSVPQNMTGGAAALTLASSGSAIPDMSSALRRSYPVFSIANSTNEYIDVNSGAVNLTYDLVEMKGVGGMDLCLSVIYNSSDSNTKEKGYTDYETTVTGYYLICGPWTEFIPLDGGNAIYIPIDENNTYTETFSTTEEVEARINQLIDDTTESEVVIGGTRYRMIAHVGVLDAGSILSYRFYSTVIDRLPHAAGKGLSAGWHFSIPYIEKIPSYDEYNTLSYTHQLLVLDTGESFNLTDYSFDETQWTSDDIIMDQTMVYPGYSFAASAESFGGKTAAHILCCKDGTKYYFDADDLCIGKEDRFGNKILYEYDSFGCLIGVRDNFGRRISVSWSGSTATVTGCDGSRAVIGSSYITCGRNETTTFTYSDVNLEFGYGMKGGSSTYVPYHILTSVAHPNGDTTVYEYNKTSAWMPDASIEYFYQIAGRYDMVSGTKKNEVSYSYSGNCRTDYSAYIIQQREQLQDGTLTAPSLWGDYGVIGDKLGMFGSYTTMVSNGSVTTEYTFNPNKRCIRSVEKIGTAEHSRVETLYMGSCVIGLYEVTYGSDGSWISAFTKKEYDFEGNVTCLQKMNAAHIVEYEESAVYGGYGFMLTHSVDGVKTVNSLSAGGKTIASVCVYEDEGETLRARTDYTYDTYGNVLTETVYILPGMESYVTTYSYTDNMSRDPGVDLDGLFCTSVTVSGLKDADGAAKENLTTVIKYDVAGRETYRMDAAGNVTTYTYDIRGRLTRTDYPDGTYETASYNISQNTVTERNRAGYILIYAYDGLGNLLTVTESGATGKVLEARTYDSRGRLSSVSNASGTAAFHTQNYAYDAFDRVVSSYIYDENDVMLAGETYAYDVVTLNGAVYHKTTKTVLGDTDAPSVVTVEYTDRYGRTARTARIFAGAELAKSYTYDMRGNLLTETDEKGSVTRYTYDFAGRVLTVKNALNQTVSYTYDSLGRKLTATDALGTTATYAYDVLGRLLTESVPLTASDAKLTKYGYDANGNVTETRVSNNAPDAPLSYSRTVSSYDSMNRLVSTTSYDGESAALVNTYTYNAYDKVLTATSGGSTTTYTYNTRGELTSVTDAMGQSETYTYDKNGNLLTKTDRSGTTFTYTYDGLGRILTETAAKGNKTEQNSYAYSLTGAVTCESNGTAVLTRKYDCLGRMIEETETASGIAAVSRYAYTVTDERERYAVVRAGTEILSEAYQYDALGRLTKVYASTAEWNANNGEDAVQLPAISGTPISIYTYDANGNRKSVENANGTVTCYRYNKANLVTELYHIRDDAVQSAYLYTYYCDGNVYTVTEYDAADELAVPAGLTVPNQIRDPWVVTPTPDPDPDPDPEPEPDLDATYSLCYYNSVVLTYQLIPAAEAPEGGLRYTVDGVEYYVNFTSGANLNYGEYVGNIVKNNNGYSGYFRFEENINPEELLEHHLILPMPQNLSSQSIFYVYYVKNASGTILQTVAMCVPEDYAYTTYTYVADGFVELTAGYSFRSLAAAETGAQSQSEPASIGKQTTYAYDGLGRLISETTVDGSDTDVISYTYDSRGNRATMTENGIVTTYTYDANNRMTAEQTGLNVKTFTYDANGNQLVALYNFNPAGTYAYNLFGYQTSYTPDNVGYTYYTYRADGLRHSVGSTAHVWDGTNIVADVSGSTVAVYFRGIGLIYTEAAGVKTYYHQNAHGDVILLTDGMGNILKTYEYDAFGREWDALDTDNNPFRYCGEYFDKQTETVYLRARYYDSAYGRFTQQDGWEYVNFGDPLSLNLYTYCWNNPGNLADPTGCWPNWKKLASAVLTVAVGVVALATVVATGGAATPLVAAGLYATAAAGVACVGFGAADALEAVTGINVVKDVMGEDLYNVAEMGCMVVASAGTNWIVSNPWLFNNYYDNTTTQAAAQTQSGSQSSNKDIKFSDKQSDYQWEKQLSERNWSKEQIVNVINNPSQMGTSINRYTGNECLVYFNEKGGYVVVDNVTGKIVQISQYDMSDFIIDKDITILPK